MKPQLAHIGVIRLDLCLLVGSRVDHSGQESVVAHSMDHYDAFLLFLGLLAGAEMEFAVGGRSTNSVDFHQRLMVETHGMLLSFHPLLQEQEAAVCCYMG